MSSSGANRIVLRRLYRSLLQAAGPFSSPSPNASVHACLLHRTGIDDTVNWDYYSSSLSLSLSISKRSEGTEDETTPARIPRPVEEARDLSISYVPSSATGKNKGGSGSGSVPLERSVRSRKAPHRLLFRRLLREALTGGFHGVRQMQFPHQVGASSLRDVIRREFRSDESIFPVETRQEVGFMALRELNKKLALLESLVTDADSSRVMGIGDDGDEKIRQYAARQAARHVEPLPFHPPESYLKPGSFLIAHPLLKGYFRRSVICILEHTESNESHGGTYGLIVNRMSEGESSSGGGGDGASHRRHRLRDVLRTLPEKLSSAFGGCVVKDGGPVHSSLQMLHGQELLGGRALPMNVPDGGHDGGHEDDDRGDGQPSPETSSAEQTKKTVYYSGNIMKAVIAAEQGQCRSEDFSFFVGASCWEVGQLESEIERGYWFPCSAPPEIALTGSCEHATPFAEEGDMDNDDHDDGNNTSHPKADDLWLSMMCALGLEEAKLAFLLEGFDGDENSEACDLI